MEELLAHADWLRRLAAHVARGDDAGAEDALQETWVAALRAPPGRDRPAQPWLAEVLRNFVRRALRGQGARQAREGRGGEAVAPATPDELLERAQAQRLLADLVMGLDEPFRATVLLRYFEGQSAAEIARAAGVPAGTVRWRLKEGLDRLRARLDQRQPDHRWVALLLPLPRTLAGAWSKGGLIVATGKKTLAGLVLLVLALLAGGLIWRAGGRAPQTTAQPALTRAEPPPRFAAAVSVPVGEVVVDDSAAGSVEGRVRSAEDGTPIAGAELSFAFQDSSLPVTTDAEGRFRFAPREAGAYLLARIAAEGYQAFAPEWGDSPVGFTLRAGERIRGVELTLRPARDCRGTLVDEAGKPVAGARLLSWTVTRGGALPGGDATTDAQGRFAFPAVPGVTVEAHHQGRMAREQLGAALPPCQLSLRLGPAREAPVTARALTIEGRVERAGAGLGGVIVEASANPVLERNARHGFARAITADDGSFSLTPLDDVAYEVTAHLGEREVATAHDVRGGARGLVLQVSLGGRLRGQVTDADSGAAVSRFAVVLSKAEAAAEGGRFGVFTRYDARGAFEIEGVPAGTYRVMVVAEGRAPADEQPATVAPDPAPPAALTFVLRAGTRVRGRVLDRQSHTPLARALVSIEGRGGMGARLLGTASVPLAAQALTGDDGRFELAGVPEGRLSLTIAASGHHGRLIGGLEISPGKPLELPDVELAPRQEGEPPRIELIGIGASLAPKGDVLVVGQLSPKGGAALAGLVPGDAIVAIDGRAVAELGFSGAIQRIRGAENTVVVLRLRRADGNEANVNVTRQLISW
jgi:RNA polymerase sigma factor (sigma-70 family)